MDEGKKNRVDQQPSAKSDQIGALAAAAHELKSPLTLINHIVHSLKDDELNLTDAERLQYLDRLEITSQRMLRLVQQLTLSYRLGDNNKMAFELNTEPLNISEICQNVLHEMTPYARQHSQQLCFKSQQRSSKLVLANRDILHGIIVNLVDNALRHNQAGESVDLSSHCRGPQVRLSVHDNGLPVSVSELSRLRRTLGTEPQPFNGRSGTSGLGLYIVGQLASSMGGSLGIGRATQGTTFFVDFIRSKQLSLL